MAKNEVSFEKLDAIIECLTEKELAILYFTAQAILLEREYVYSLNEVFNE